ncbi:MAG: hypothetical protein DME54_00790 [Verrucomicrobia bacterium]|nr:MAG: hypothetical protein DME54_00790 [Verrucomicrobiota bacterium]
MRPPTIYIKPALVRLFYLQPPLSLEFLTSLADSRFTPESDRAGLASTMKTPNRGQARLFSVCGILTQLKAARVAEVP